MKLSAQRFEFVSYHYNRESRVASFMYEVKTDKHTYVFTERLTLPEKTPHTDAPAELIEACMNGLHLILGISYWKAFCPPEIVIINQELSVKQAQFWNTVYENGLGEFFFRNKIDYRKLVSFPAKARHETKATSHAVEHRGLLGLGGGKDSIVAAEMLKHIEYPFDMFVVETQNKYPLIRNVAKKIGTDVLYVHRELDPQLFVLNASGDVYNGHIPASAVYAFIGYFLSVLYGYEYVIVPNEHSANIGNVEYLGKTVNHQWSKSQEFEILARDYMRQYMSDSISYVSILRPLTELKIMSYMTQYPQYLSLFSSCNNNFKVVKEHRTSSRMWCGKCPKCAAVFIGLAAQMPLQKVINIFGANILVDSSMVQMYRDLLGIGTMKPFECVGTFEENQAALYMIMKKQEAADTPVMKMFVSDCLPTIHDPENLVTQQLSPDRSVHLPEPFTRLFEIYEHSPTAK